MQVRIAGTKVINCHLVSRLAKRLNNRRHLGTSINPRSVTSTLSVAQALNADAFFHESSQLAGKRENQRQRD